MGVRFLDICFLNLPALILKTPSFVAQEMKKKITVTHLPKKKKI